MYIPWEWIRGKIECSGSFLAGELIEQLNYHGLECEKHSTAGILFINFITAHNRRDLKSWWGLIREISVLLNLRKARNFPGIVERENWSDHSIGNLQFRVRSKQVTEYSIISLYNLVESHCLPTWMLQSLRKNGIRTVNTIIDIANLTTLETGQPLHVFDLEKLQHISSGKEITIKEASGGEVFVDLSGKERKLPPGSLLMETNGRVVELMGVIGGSSTAVDQTTKQFLVESGSFSPTAIELTCNQTGIRTRASENFINTYNQEDSGAALRRFKETVGKFYSYQKDSTEHFSLPLNNKKKENCRKLGISTDFLTRKLGILTKEEKIETTLGRLNFPFEKDGSLYTVQIPSFRSDIQIAEDLLEEIGKLLDYNLLPGSLPAFQNQFINLQFNNTYSLRRKIALYLLSNGYQEVLSYSLTESVDPQKDSKVLLANPKSSTRVAYRTSFINSHLEIIRHNQGQGCEDLFLFEEGIVYSVDSSSSLPVQEEILSVIATGKVVSSGVHQLTEQTNIYWIKGLLENLLTIMNIDEFIVEKARFTSLMDLDYPLVVNQKRVGFIRQLSSRTLAENRVKNAPCFVLQLSFSKLLPILDKQEDRKYSPVSYLPVITKNISFLTKKNTSLEQIIGVIREAGGEFLSAVSLVDVYDKEKKDFLYSLNFQLLFQGRNVNLQNAEIEVVIEKIWTALVAKFSVLRR